MLSTNDSVRKPFARDINNVRSYVANYVPPCGRNVVDLGCLNYAGDQDQAQLSGPWTSDIRYHKPWRLYTIIDTPSKSEDQHLPVLGSYTPHGAC